ncbi:hypothetical protein GA0070610_1722 [Micromonospora echinofusca]|uniref:Uncharacterized protein n=1 Tax=Micromonospora echinofusca TaxID=47858 RepID=A0A1C5G6K7_MICEH|nr:hypothetical protein GA0070610_1722 [Micromonospora echinofusca]
MSRRRKPDAEAWIVLEVRAPRWAVWSVGIGVVLLAAANAAAVVVLLAVGR